ncbi:MAG TPA: OpgC domain-containing protein [Stellaceae bacterium]|nr:OpgC domain-containing protein [Stellaceae bacterium]
MAEAFPRAGRDLRLDFFRGLSLFFIFIDHIPGNPLRFFTLHSIAFSDAAEVFIFISGYTAALVYGRSVRQHGALFASAQIYRRVWQLYVAHIFLFMIFTAEVSYAVLTLKNPMYTEELHVGDFLTEPYIAIIKALLLQFQPTYLDILPLYIALLGFFPLVLLALERGALWALLPSAALYALTLRHGWGLPAYPEHLWYFNPLAWQFLFVIGASAGHARVSGRWPFPHGAWLSQAAVAIVGICALINLTWLAHWIWPAFPAVLAKPLLPLVSDKSNLAPLRLVNSLALALATVYFVRPHSAFLSWRIARPIIRCGQHSLYVFCLGIVLAVCGHFILTEFYAALPLQILVNLVGFALMIGTASLLTWYRHAASRERSARPTVAATPSE